MTRDRLLPRCALLAVALLAVAPCEGQVAPSPDPAPPQGVPQPEAPAADPPVAAARGSISDQESGWTLELPEGWYLASAGAIDAINQEASKASIGANVRFTHALTTSPDGVLRYPYILVQLTSADLRQATYDDVARMLSPGAIQSGIRQGESSSTDKVQGTVGVVPLLDQERGVATFRMDLQVAGVGDVKGYIWMFLGADRVIQLNCYSPAATAAGDLQRFEEIASTFRFAPGKAFKPAAVSPITVHNLGRIAGMSLLGVIAALIVARFIKRRTGANPG